MAGKKGDVPDGVLRQVAVGLRPCRPAVGALADAEAGHVSGVERRGRGGVDGDGEEGDPRVSEESPAFAAVQGEQQTTARGGVDALRVPGVARERGRLEREARTPQGLRRPARAAVGASEDLGEARPRQDDLRVARVDRERGDVEGLDAREWIDEAVARLDPGGAAVLRLEDPVARGPVGRRDGPGVKRRGVGRIDGDRLGPVGGKASARRLPDRASAPPSPDAASGPDVDRRRARGRRNDAIHAGARRTVRDPGAGFRPGPGRGERREGERGPERSADHELPEPPEPLRNCRPYILTA